MNHRVGDPVHGDGVEPGIAKHDLVGGVNRRVAVIGGGDVGRQRDPQFRDHAEQLNRHFRSPGFEVDLGFAILMVAADAIVVLQCSTDLGGQQTVQAIDGGADVVADVAGVQPGFAAVTRVQNVLDQQQDFDDGVLRRQRAMAQMVDRVGRRVGRHDRLGQFRQQVWGG